MAGECQLENMRTLCVACHLEVTKAQQREHRMVRKMAKEQLKITMKQLETAKFLTSGHDVCFRLSYLIWLSLIDIFCH